MLQGTVIACVAGAAVFAVLGWCPAAFAQSCLLPRSSTASRGDWRSQIASPSAQAQLRAPAAGRAVVQRLRSVRCCATTEGQCQAEGLAQARLLGWGPGWEPGAEPLGCRDVQEQVSDPAAAKFAFRGR